MKVVIADDEVHICSLVKHLIDWDGLGLTLSGVCHNGSDVLAHFEREPADILICDIEMPGMSGNDLIREISGRYPACKCMVISGFRVFEYARAAMQYGVTKYLLKPINGEELNAALRELVSDERTGQGLSNSIGEQTVRFGLVDLLESGLESETVRSVNQKYHYKFSPGMFRVVKAVFTDIDVHSEDLPRVMRIFTESLRQKLADFCTETEIFRISALSAIILVNYDPETFLPQVLDHILRSTLVELGGKTQCKCCFGVGVAVGRIEELRLSWQSAKKAVCGRIADENRQTFYAKGADSAAAAALSAQERQELVNCIEAIDIQGIKKWADDSFSARAKLFLAQPHCAFEFCFLAVDLMLVTFDDLNVSIPDKDALRKNAEMLFDSCGTLAALQERLTAAIVGEVAKRLHEKQQNIAVYAQQAKNYIDKHYQGAITLELIAEKLHISPVYLSVVFKSEIGMNYSKYLSLVRVNKAKELLKSCDMNLSQIANAVGYDSTTYFSSLFRKLVGIKPLEYRRLYQHNIGEDDGQHE